MKISMTYFAQIRRAAGAETEDLDLPANATALAAVKAAVGKHGDDFRRLVLAADGNPHANLIVLLNEVPVSSTGQTLKDGDKLSLFSPVAGG